TCQGGTCKAGICSASSPSTPSTLVAAHSVWKYLDDGSNQGIAWRATSFSDGGWKSGVAQLGYGEGDEATVVGYGPSSSNKYITTYFRRTFTVSDPSKYSALNLSVMRDDGAVVYVNGTEVWRDNLPSGTITSTTLAYDASDDGKAWNQSTLPTNGLVSGTN